MKKIFTILFILLNAYICGSISSSQEKKAVLFRFKQKPRDVFTINGNTKVNYYQNNVLKSQSNSKWSSVQKALQKTSRGIKFSYDFGSRKKSGKTNTGRGEFIRNDSGKMYFDKNAFYPQSTGTPAFPDKKISISNFWEKPGEEIIDFRSIGIKKPFRLKFNARYRYLKNKTLNGRKHAVIQCFYVVNKNLNNLIHVPGYSRVRPRYLKPARLIGKYERIYYWDIKNGYWTRMIGKINFILTFTNALTIEWKSRVIASQRKK